MLERVNGYSHLLKRVSVALATLCIHGSETHVPAGLFKKFKKMKNAARAPFTIQFGHDGSTHQNASILYSHSISNSGCRQETHTSWHRQTSNPMAFQGKQTRQKLIHKTWTA